jgi:hypothetical protein
MADLLYVVLMVVLTAIGVLFAIGCDRLIGPDEPELAEKTGTRAEAERQIEELAA